MNILGVRLDLLYGCKFMENTVVNKIELVICVYEHWWMDKKQVVIEVIVHRSIGWRGFEARSMGADHTYLPNQVQNGDY